MNSYELHRLCDYYPDLINQAISLLRGSDQLKLHDVLIRIRAWNNLDVDSLCLIFQYLDLSSLIVQAHVNKAWNSAMRKQQVWHKRVCDFSKLFAGRQEWSFVVPIIYRPLIRSISIKFHVKQAAEFLLHLSDYAQEYTRLERLSLNIGTNPSSIYIDPSSYPCNCIQETNEQKDNNDEQKDDMSDEYGRICACQHEQAQIYETDRKERDFVSFTNEQVKLPSSLRYLSIEYDNHYQMYTLMSHGFDPSSCASLEHLQLRCNATDSTNNITMYTRVLKPFVGLKRLDCHSIHLHGPLDQIAVQIQLRECIVEWTNGTEILSSSSNTTSRLRNLMIDYCSGQVQCNIIVDNLVLIGWWSTVLAVQAFAERCLSRASRIWIRKNTHYTYADEKRMLQLIFEHSKYMTHLMIASEGKESLEWFCPESKSAVLSDSLQVITYVENQEFAYKSYNNSLNQWSELTVCSKTKPPDRWSYDLFPQLTEIQTCTVPTMIDW